MRTSEYNFDLLPNKWLAKSERECCGMAHAERIVRQGPTAGYPTWGLLYYAVLSSLPLGRPSVVVETGTNRGLTAIILGQAVKDHGRGGSVHSIEKDVELRKIARKNIEEAGLTDIVDVWSGDSVAVLQAIKWETIDFAFLDSNHTAEHVMAEFEALWPSLKPGSVVAFDNAAAGSVAMGIAAIKEKHGGNVVLFKSCSWCPPGVAFWQGG